MIWAQILGLNLHYLMFYAHISPIMLGVGFFEFLIADLRMLSQVLGEKYDV